jgi:hypothetical protein
MSTETQYGYKIPELEDKDFWDSYNFNFERLDQHDHDGVNSKDLASSGGSGKEVSTEAELDTELAALTTFIIIAASFNITSRKVLYGGLKIEGKSLGAILIGIGMPASESLFLIPVGVSGVILTGLSIETAQTDIDLIAIVDTAVKNLISDCLLTLPALTTRSSIYVDGQRNKIVANNSDFDASLSSPGNIFLDANSAENVVNANIIT